MGVISKRPLIQKVFQNERFYKLDWIKISNLPNIQDTNIYNLFHQRHYVSALYDSSNDPFGQNSHCNEDKYKTATYVSSYDSPMYSVVKTTYYTLDKHRRLCERFSCVSSALALCQRLNCTQDTQTLSLKPHSRWGYYFPCSLSFDGDRILLYRWIESHNLNRRMKSRTGVRFRVGIIVRRK